MARKYKYYCFKNVVSFSNGIKELWSVTENEFQEVVEQEKTICDVLDLAANQNPEPPPPQPEIFD